MSSNQLDPRSMADVQTVSHFAAPGSPEYEHDYRMRQSAWVAWVNFAGVMLVLLGSFHVIEGLVALFRDEVFVVGRQGLVLNVDYTVWGWMHVVFGALTVLVGSCLLAGQMWARIVAVIVAGLSALANVAFLPAYPVLSAVMIAVDILVIWAITIHGGELREPKA
jgi:hypothetical protein